MMIFRLALPRRLNRPMGGRLLAVAAMVFALFLAAPVVAHASSASTIQNGDATGQISRFDVDGNSLDAHDGSILQVGNTFYLYGTSYACGYGYQVNSSFCGFKVYGSFDLTHWTDRGYILAPGACSYCFRPHVVYNASTGKYVLWADGGGHYIVAASPTPTGLFTRQADPSLSVGGAVDESLFVDDDGTGYVIHNTTLDLAPGTTADMVVEKLTADYLNTNGQSVRLGLGDVEAFTVFKRAGVYHALMSDPSCAYCSGGTGEMTATSMLGPWSGAWYDPNGVHQSGRAEPRYRARIVNQTNCGGQPLASFPVASGTGTTTYLFVSDRWNNRAPNESLANLYIGPMSFDSTGALQDISCLNSTNVTVPGPAGADTSPPDLDQSSGSAGFHHYCDIAANVERQQRFTASRTGSLSALSITTFQGGSPNAPLTLDVLDAGTGALLSRDDLPVATVPWAPTALTVRPALGVSAGHTYLVRLHSATSSGCYGWEYADANPYPGGEESYSTNSGATFTSETGRDLKFSASVSSTPVLSPAGLPAGFTACASEGGSCAFTGTRMVAYGVGSSPASYRTRIASGSINCGIVAFGADPDLNVVKSCAVSPLGGPAGFTACASEGGSCAVTGPTLVAYGANGGFVYRLLGANSACTNTAFGADPILGVSKGCYLAPNGGPSGWTACASEGGSCAATGARRVIYGARGAFFARWVTGPATCDTATFGGDPIYGVLKSCYTT